MTNESNRDFRQSGTDLVRTLRDAGYIAYFAGGWVRDLLLGHPSGDVDIATEAPPETVMQLFPKTVPVGVAFGVVIVIHQGVPFEVTSFRKDGLYLYGRRPETIEFAMPEEDARRRDFTINGIFYDPLADQVIDYVGGQEDLQKGIIRAIGDPIERIKEDRLRMIRAVRMMARFGFQLDSATREAIVRFADSLYPAVAVERVWQEFNKMAEFPGFDRGLIEMHSLGLLQQIFPTLLDTSFETIKDRLSPCPLFPKQCPTILYVAQLFPDASVGELELVCEALKVPRRDANLLSYYQEACRHYASDMADQVSWAYLYAHPYADLCRAVFAARLLEADHGAFLERHEIRRRELAPHIDRIREKLPLVRAVHLQRQGILPGRQMGVLLKEAEKLAIEHDLHDPESVLSRLKRSLHWPKEIS